MAIKLDFEVNEDLTYCDKTQNCAEVAGLPYPVFLYILLLGPFVVWLHSFGALIASLISIYAISKLLKKSNIPLSQVIFYLNEKKSNKRRALPRRRFILYKYGKRL